MSTSKEEAWLLREKYDGVPSKEYEGDCTRLQAGEPLAYVIGHLPFLGLTIHLDSKPLIPRPETEWWTEQLLESFGVARDANDRSETRDDNFAQPCGADQKLPLSRETGNERARHSQITFLDLCAGSGAIGCAALAKLPNAHVYFGEIDPAHKETILKNIRENHLDESRAVIGIGDLFEPFANTVFNVIAINPPYIPTSRVLDHSVADFEPLRALFSGSDGLTHIRRIAHDIKEHLSEDGVAWIECDRAHVRDAQNLFITAGLVAKIRTDQYGVPRILVVTHPAPVDHF